MPRDHHLGEFEQLVLMAVLRLGDGAHGTSVARELETKAGRSVSRGALYSSLDRLEQKGYVTWELGEATPQRGGQPKRCFSVTPEGVEALRESYASIVRLSDGLEELLDRGPT